MRIAVIPGTENVLRFPVERRARPTLELLRALAPDVRLVLNMAEAFGLEEPMADLRHRADAETAAYIAAQVPAEHGAARQAALQALLEPVVACAVVACREAEEAEQEAAAAQERLVRAQTVGSGWLEPLDARATALTQEVAERLLLAHARSEEAEGVARAVHLAEQGEPWTPFSLQAEAEALFFGAA